MNWMEKPAIKAFLSLLCLILTSAVTAQDNPTNRRISVKLTNVTVTDALNEISKRGYFLLSYNAAGIDGNRRVTLNETNQPVKKVLEKTLGDGFTLKSGGSHIIIIPDKPKQVNASVNQKYAIKGTIKDALTGDKISYASVYQVGEFNTTLSNSEGLYQMNLKGNPEFVRLLISRKNYRDTVLVIRPAEKNQLEIRLRPAAPISTLTPVAPTIPDAISDNSLFRIAVSDEQLQVTENLAMYEQRMFQIGLVPVLGSNRNFGGLVENHFSLNLVGGYSMALTGVEVAGVFNITRRHVHGVRLGGFMNITGGALRGVQLAGGINNNVGAINGVQAAGLFNLSLDSLRGVQASGVFNLAKGRVRGVQISGFANVSGKELKGVQAAGFSNLTGGSTDGVQVAGFMNNNAGTMKGCQIAGFYNLSLDTLNGVQAAGFLNISRHQVNGSQIAGFCNVASGDVNGIQVSGFYNMNTGNIHGAQITGGINVCPDSAYTFQAAGIANFAHRIKGSQISGILNIAGRVGGSQLSLINICDTVKGVSFGLISIVRQGYHKFEISGGSFSKVLFTIRTGTHRFYNVISAGMFDPLNPSLVTFGYGIGTEFRSGKKFFFGIDAVTSIVFNEKLSLNYFPDIWNRSNLYIGYRPVKWFEFFGGPAFNSFQIDKRNDSGIHPTLPGRMLLSQDISGNPLVGWLGWQAGIRFF